MSRLKHTGVAIAAGARSVLAEVGAYRMRLLLISFALVLLSILASTVALVCTDIVDYHLDAAKQILTTSAELLASGSDEFPGAGVVLAELAEAKSWSRVASSASDLSVVLVVPGALLWILCLVSIGRERSSAAAEDVPATLAAARATVAAPRSRTSGGRMKPAEIIAVLISTLGLGLAALTYLDSRDPVQVQIVPPPSSTPSSSPPRSSP